MKNKKYLFSLVVTLLVFIPQFVFASWWNPFTWFPNMFFRKTTQVQSNQESTKIINQKEIISEVPVKESAVIKPSKNKTNLPIQNAGLEKKESDDVANYRNEVINLFTKQIISYNTQQSLEGLFIDSTERQILDLEDNINLSEGFKKGDPNSIYLMDYITKIDQQQIDFYKDEIKARKFIQAELSRLKTEQAYFTNDLHKINSIEQLEIQKQKIQSYKDQLSKLTALSQEWSVASRKMKTTKDGIMAGLSSHYSSSSKLPTVTPVATPPSSIPSLYSLDCTTSKTVVGDLRTQCY